MPYPSALEGNPKYIFFTDFDGTITLQDSNDMMTDNLGFGQKRRKELNKDCLDGTSTFRDTFQEMLDSISTPFPECVDYLLEHITLDPHFTTFYNYCLTNSIPVIVLSSGMTPIIRALLHKLVGPTASHIEIICNEAVPRPGKTMADQNGWTIRFHDDSGFGHDKSLAIRPYREHFVGTNESGRPMMFYAGDGVSDLSAARETDLLFAKKGRDLVTYCEREGVPFTVFEDWRDILGKMREICEGKISVDEVAKETYEDVKTNGHADKTTTTK
ncbi:hypothetical protein MMC19_002309 [Ptychographa xylographoides]|nr:hypothetical protein [Ptychographa xylographoides]